MESSTATIHPDRKLLSFVVAGHTCGMPLECVSEIVPMAALSHPPGLPLILEGFLNLGGNFVPVIRLDRLFSLPEQIPGLNTHLLIVHGKDAPNALLVDRVEELLSIPVDAVAPVRQELSFNGCVIAEIQVGDKIIHLISPERVLLEQEAQRINELRAIVQQRLQNLETEQT